MVIVGALNYCVDCLQCIKLGGAKGELTQSLLALQTREERPSFSDELLDRSEGHKADGCHQQSTLYIEKHCIV